MKYSTGHRKSKGQIKRHKSNINAAALQESLKAQALERIAGWQTKIDELLKQNGPVEQINFFNAAIERMEALYA